MIRLDPDSILDACIEEAARLSGAPIALVSLVMRHVQVFRAHRGLPPELALSCATSRRSSFCQFAVRDELPFLVEDAASDPRVPQELVERYGIRAYAGVPVRVDGQVLGTLCVIDVQPRRFEPAVVEALSALGARVGARLGELVSAEEPIEGPPSTARDRLRLLRRMARLLEGALQALGPALEQARAAEIQGARALTDDARADLREAIRCHQDLVEAARDLSAEAARIARAGPDPRRELVLAEARALERELAEVAPLVRLAEAALSEQVDVEAAAKAASVTVEALEFHEEALATVRRLLAAADAADAARTEAAALRKEVTP